MQLIKSAGVAVSLCGLALTGCASSNAPTVRQVADRFYSALSYSDGATACDLLAPKTRSEIEESSGTSCEEAVLGEDVPAVGAVEATEVFGDQAQLRFAGDTVFLARYPDGWKVVAAACTPRPDLPYDCTVKGS